MEQIPKAYQDHPQFQKYYEIWCRNEASFVFVPLADMLVKEGLLEEARTVCERGLKHHPGSVSGRLILASVYWSLGQKEAADGLAQAILKEMPDHPGAGRYLLTSPAVSSSPLPQLPKTMTMADILAGQGAYREACQIVQVLLESEPGNEKLSQRLQQWQQQEMGQAPKELV